MAEWHALHILRDSHVVRPAKCYSMVLLQSVPMKHMSEPEQNPLEHSASHASRAAEMTAEQLAEAKRYGRQKLICELAGRLLNLLFLATMAFLVARPLDAALAGLVARDSLRLVALFVITVALH